MNDSNITNTEYEQFLKNFGLVLNQASLYTVKHRIAQDAISRFYDNLQQIISADKLLELSISDDHQTIILNGHSLESVNPLIKNLLLHLSARRFVNAKITNEITKEHITTFFEIINSDPEKIESSGGLSKTIENSKIKGIFLEKVVYKRISHGQKVVNKKETSSKGQDNSIMQALQKGSFDDEIDKKQIFNSLQSTPEKLAHLSVKASFDSAPPEKDSEKFNSSLEESLKRIGTLALQKIKSTSSVRTKKSILKAFEVFEKEIIKYVKDISSQTISESAEDFVHKVISEYRNSLELDIISGDFQKKKQ
ncbi:MAG: hypothetical protein KAI72_06050, partial [Candidatus Pacebacteria bacterium]|nr:hypothetical protein [Candidatus Paceibacterota bacterium]